MTMQMFILYNDLWNEYSDVERLLTIIVCAECACNRQNQNYFFFFQNNEFKTCEIVLLKK